MLFGRFHGQPAVNPKGPFLGLWGNTKDQRIEGLDCSIMPAILMSSKRRAAKNAQK